MAASWLGRHGAVGNDALGFGPGKDGTYQQRV